MNLKHNNTTKYSATKWNNNLLRKGMGGVLTTQNVEAKTPSNNTP
jgi:hypothetical protein